MTATHIVLTVRCAAFSGEGVRVNRVRVEADGTVRVYDSVAGYYTTCHSLSPAMLRRIAKMTKIVASPPLTTPVY